MHYSSNQNIEIPVTALLGKLEQPRNPVRRCTHPAAQADIGLARDRTGQHLHAFGARMDARQLCLTTCEILKGFSNGP